MHVVIMGVSGSGKTTVGEMIAQRLGSHFVDSDALHPPANIAKMSAGIPLDDADRKPWLEVVGQTLAAAGDESIVIACSALQKSYRDIIRNADPTARFVLLHGPREMLAQRISQRGRHFMPLSLLQSQLDALELLDASESGIMLSIAEAPGEVADQAVALLRTTASDPSGARLNPPA